MINQRAQKQTYTPGSQSVSPQPGMPGYRKRRRTKTIYQQIETMTNFHRLHKPEDKQYGLMTLKELEDEYIFLTNKMQNVSKLASRLVQKELTNQKVLASKFHLKSQTQGFYLTSANEEDKLLDILLKCHERKEK